MTNWPILQSEDEGRLSAVDAAGAAGQVGELEPDGDLLGAGLKGRKVEEQTMAAGPFKGTNQNFS